MVNLKFCRMELWFSPNEIANTRTTRFVLGAIENIQMYSVDPTDSKPRPESQSLLTSTRCDQISFD